MAGNWPVTMTRVATTILGLVMAAGCASPPGAPVAPDSAHPQVPSATTGQPSASADAADSTTSPIGDTAQTSLVNCAYQPYGEPARPVDPPPTTDVKASGTFTVTLHMTEGPVVIALDRSSAPCTVNSFETLVKQGFYDDTSCHRLVDQGLYLLQCGDPTGTGSGGPGYRFDDELTGTEAYPAGAVAMANNGPNTNGSQFFIVWADSDIPPTSTVFGTVAGESLGVVTTIASRGVSAEHSPRPISPARIEQVSLG